MPDPSLWLWWYTFEADAQHSDPVKKAMARDDANRIIDNMFDVNPCFHITKNRRQNRIPF